MGVFVSFLSGAVRLGTTFLYGSTGETLTEKSGHLNLGIPGIMCFGALGGCIGVSMVGSVPVLTVLVAIIFSFCFFLRVANHFIPALSLHAEEHKGIPYLILDC